MEQEGNMDTTTAAKAATTTTTTTSLQVQPLSSLSFSGPGPSSNADLILVSKDKIPFYVQKRHLAASSIVFSDMFDLSSSSSSSSSSMASLSLPESAEDLKALLQYTEPHQVDPVVLNLPQQFSLIRALDKYAIWRGLDAFARAFQSEDLLQHAQTADRLSMPVYAYLFAAQMCDAPIRARAMSALRTLGPSPAEVEKAVRDAVGMMQCFEDGSALIHDYTKQCYEIFAAHHQLGESIWPRWRQPSSPDHDSQSINDRFSPNYTSVDYYNQQSRSHKGPTNRCTPMAMHDLWNAAARCRSTEAIDRVRQSAGERVECSHCRDVVLCVLGQFGRAVKLLQKES